MRVGIGNPLPTFKLKTMMANQVTEVDVRQLFEKGKGVLFGVPSLSRRDAPETICQATSINTKP